MFHEGEPFSSPCLTKPVQFQAFQNINSFIVACEKFGLQQGDVFKAEDLYYGCNFESVIRTLSRLSHTLKATQAGLL